MQYKVVGISHQMQYKVAGISQPLFDIPTLIIAGAVLN